MNKMTSSAMAILVQSRRIQMTDIQKMKQEIEQYQKEKEEAKTSYENGEMSAFESDSLVTILDMAIDRLKEKIGEAK